MINKMRSFISRYKEPVLYIVFGLLTTAVNYLVYLPLYNLAYLSASASNIIAWFLSACVAFITNKLLVFESKNLHPKTVLLEAIKFFGCRIGTGALETLILLLAVDIMRLDGNVWKIIVSILVVILNYVMSKLYIFPNK